MSLSSSSTGTLTKGSVNNTSITSGGKESAFHSNAILNFFSCKSTSFLTYSLSVAWSIDGLAELKGLCKFGNLESEFPYIALSMDFLSCEYWCIWDSNCLAVTYEVPRLSGPELFISGSLGSCRRFVKSNLGNPASVSIFPNSNYACAVAPSGNNCCVAPCTSHCLNSLLFHSSNRATSTNINSHFVSEQIMC